MDRGNILAKVGFWAFIVGLIVSIIAGIIAPANIVVTIILIILGIIIGFLNITAKEVMLFLVATIALVVVGNAFAALPIIGKIVGPVLSYVVTLMAPAAIIGAIKALWALGKPGD